ncbi:MAG: hypothetical protein FWD47_11005 [Treponema sp.]|nr:hypothetical protein [Treponema sp.]
MKKIFLFILMIFMLVLCIFAEDKQKSATGAGLELNMNSRENFAVGAVINFDYKLGSSFAAGINLTASNNFSGIIVIEPAAMFRFYFLGNNHAGWFVQTDAGAYLVLEDDDLTPMFLGGLRAGLRLPLGSKFFAEPFGRIGYPFVFGVGVLAGIRF